MAGDIVKGLFGFISDERAREDVARNLNNFSTGVLAGVPGLPGDLADVVGQATGLFRVPSNWRSEGMQRSLGGDPEAFQSLLGGLLSPGPGEAASAIPTAMGIVVPMTRKMVKGTEWLNSADRLQKSGATPEEVWEALQMFKVPGGEIHPGAGNVRPGTDVWYKEFPGDNTFSWKHPNMAEAISNSPGQSFGMMESLNIPQTWLDAAPSIARGRVMAEFDEPNVGGQMDMVNWLSKKIRKPMVSVNPINRVWNRDPLGVLTHEIGGHAVELSNPAYTSVRMTPAEIEKYGPAYGTDKDLAKELFRKHGQLSSYLRDATLVKEYLTMKRYMSDDDIMNVYGEDWYVDATMGLDRLEQSLLDGARVHTNRDADKLINKIDNTIGGVKTKERELWDTFKQTSPERLYSDSLGETFARTVESRRNMDTLQRKQTPFWHSTTNMYGEKGPQDYEGFLKNLLLVPHDMVVKDAFRPAWAEENNPLITGSGLFLPD